MRTPGCVQHSILLSPSRRNSGLTGDGVWVHLAVCASRDEIRRYGTWNLVCNAGLYRVHKKDANYFSTTVSIAHTFQWHDKQFLATDTINTISTFNIMLWH